jgi:hypothetical protein
MVSIEKEDFNVNERVLHKGLARLEYKKINNQYIKENVIQEHNKGITPSISEVPRKVSKVDRIEALDINILLELQHLIEPIKEVKQKLFKIDIDVLSDWEKFVKKNSQFKVQDLISLALEEFIQKYN